MYKKFQNFSYCFLVVSNFFNHVQKCPKFLIVQNFSSSSSQNVTSIHRFSLPFSTISPYLNSYPIIHFLHFWRCIQFFKYISKFFSLDTQWGVLTPKTPLAYASAFGETNDATCWSNSPESRSMLQQDQERSIRKRKIGLLRLAQLLRSLSNNTV